jgi:hypothetical protein
MDVGAGLMLQWFVGGSVRMFGIPRRCPVDDAPHTTCTSADYDGSKYPAGTSVVVPVVRPLVLDELLDTTAANTPAPPAVDTVSAPFTTATYRGRARRKVRP